MDCFSFDLPRKATLAEFVEAFYTSDLFRLERWVLRLLVRRGSTDDEARALARGERDSFAAWAVEARAPDQLLMREFTGRTRSWFMTAPVPEAAGTRLYFGSVVVPARSTGSGPPDLGPVHGRLIGFHARYSRMLLRAAARRLAAAQGG